MAQSQNNLTAVLQDIADAIRSKKGTSATICPRDYADEIASIPSGGTNKLPSLVDGTITSVVSGDISNTTTTIKQYLFRNCTSLTTVLLPNSVTTIEQYAFYGCSNLTTIISSSLTSIDNYAFRNCTSLTTIDLSSVISINDYAFASCSSLVSVNLSNVTSVKTAAFQYCSSLADVNSLSKVTSLDAYCFRGCPSLAGNIVLTKVKTIGTEAFHSTNGLLTSVIIGANCTSIGSQAFNEQANIVSVTINRTTPPTLSSASAFGTKYTYPIYVPASAVATYKAATNWSSLSSRIQAIPT